MIFEKIHDLIIVVMARLQTICIIIMMIIIALVDSAVGNVLDKWTIAQCQSGAISPVGLSFTKQHEWDKPSIATGITRLNSSPPDRYDQARLLAVSASHGDDWLHALPISSCGLRRDEDAITCPVGLYVLKPGFVSLISAQAAPWSVRFLLIEPETPWPDQFNV